VRRCTVRVPASSANLGPGFDVLAAALDLHVEVDVAETGRFAVSTDLPIARNRRNLCVRGFAALHPPDLFAFTIRSDVPLSGGLGTSAAAIVAGLTAARAITGAGDDDLLPVAAGLEGHPDNVAAALLGGFVVCAGARAERIEVPDGLEAVVAVPDEAVRTAQARGAMPAEVPLPDAVFNVGHAALLVLGLARGDRHLIARGLRDRLHQPARTPLYPRSMALVGRAPDLGALGATISGAGPSVLLWCAAEDAAAVAERAEAEVAGWGRVLRTGFAREGAAVLTRRA
jgi:homoserine kinase